MTCPLVVGLTGGVGSGKTAASDIFAQLGVPVIDTDLIAREVVEPGQPAVEQIESAFGSEVITEAGGIDRARLRQRIFSEPTLREALERILHPKIREVAERRIDAVEAPYCIVVVPLLVESGMLDLVNRVLVIDAPEAQQIARVQKRDDVTPEEAERILQAQASRSRRLEHADDVVVNDGSLDDLRRAVQTLDHRYRRLSHQ